MDQRLIVPKTAIENDRKIDIKKFEKSNVVYIELLL